MNKPLGWTKACRDIFSIDNTQMARGCVGKLSMIANHGENVNESHSERTPHTY